MKQNEVLAMLHDIVAENRQYTTWTVSTPHLVMLVNQAVKAEREACAAILDANAEKCVPSSTFQQLLKSNAAAIRARNNND